MKKIYIPKVALLLPLTFSAMYALTSCANKVSVALVTSSAEVNALEDEGFTEIADLTIGNFCDEHNLNYEAYIPSSADLDGYLHSLNKAIDSGATYIVALGSTFQESIKKLAPENKNITFLLVDDVLKDYDNVVSIQFNEAQAGFLAGYAAAKEGYSKVGFMGGVSVDPVKRYGMGYMQGLEMGSEGHIEVNYAYAETFAETHAIQVEASDWYSTDVETIFSCGGNILNSIIKAGESYSDTTIIGVDTDQSSVSEKIITSATKNISQAISDNLESHFVKDSTKLPIYQYYDASNNGIKLPTSDWKLTNFTIDEYNEIFDKIADSTIEVDVDVSKVSSKEKFDEYISTFTNLSGTWKEITVNV